MRLLRLEMEFRHEADQCFKNDRGAIGGLLCSHRAGSAEAILMDDNAKFNRLFWQMEAVEGQLKARSGDQSGVGSTIRPPECAGASRQRRPRWRWRRKPPDACFEPRRPGRNFRRPAMPACRSSILIEAFSSRPNRPHRLREPSDMSRTKLANLTVDQLVERFVAIALDQHEAMRHDDNAKYNRLYGQMDDVKQELKSRAGDQRRALASVTSTTQRAGQAEIRDNDACVGAAGRSTDASSHQRPARISCRRLRPRNDETRRTKEVHSQLSGARGRASHRSRSLHAATASPTMESPEVCSRCWTGTPATRAAIGALRTMASAC